MSLLINMCVAPSFEKTFVFVFSAYFPGSVIKLKLQNNNKNTRLNRHFNKLCKECIKEQLRVSRMLKYVSTKKQLIWLLKQSKNIVWQEL